MAPVLLLVALAQVPDAGEPAERIIIVPIPVPPTPAPEPIPPPLSPQPEGIDAVPPLRIGKPDGAIGARAGAVRLKTLGNGHVINRYSNQDLADYHPAAGNAGFRLGPVRGEFFASDVFGARIFAGLFGLELGRLA